MLCRIHNAVRVRRKNVTMPCSGVKVGIAKVLQEEGYIHGFDVVKDTKQGVLRIDLKYGPRGEEIIRRLHRESHSGGRVYRGVDKLPRVMDGMGIAIVSTSRGVLSDRQCREQKVGGELLCTVY